MDAGSGGSGGKDGGGAGPDAAPTTGKAFVYVGGNWGGTQITTFRLDLTTGALAGQLAVTAGSSPTNLAVHPGGKFLYVANEETAGMVLAFAVNQTTGALTMLNQASSGGAEPAHISVHRSGKWLLTSNYASGTVAALPIGDDGRLGAPVQPIPRAGGQAHMILDDGVTGNFVFVPCKADNRIAQYRFDVATGKLTPNTPATVDAGNAPRHMAFHPSGKAAYLTHEVDLTVTRFSYDSTTGVLSAPANTPAAMDGAHALVHPNGRFLYALVRGANKLTVFDLDDSGAVGTGTDVTGFFAMPYDFTLSRDGKLALVVNAANSTVKVFSVSAETGGLTSVGSGGMAVDQPHSIALAVF